MKSQSEVYRTKSIDVPIRTGSLTTSAQYIEQNNKSVYLSLKCAELRCKKGLCWQTYSLLTNQSESNNERKKRRNNGPQTYST